MISGSEPIEPDEFPTAVKLAVLEDTYRVGELLYMMHGREIPEGYSFTRRLDAVAERCWNAAAIAVYNRYVAEFELTQ